MLRDVPTSPPRAKHQQQLDEMHDALYQLGDKARTPFKGSGANLLPDQLTPKEKPEQKAAKSHISRLHKAFKSLKKGKE